MQIASVLIEQERAMYTADQSFPVAAVVLLDDRYSSVGTIMTSSLADSTHTAIRAGYSGDGAFAPVVEALKKDDTSLLHADTPAEIRLMLQKGFFRIIEGLIYRVKGLRSAVVVIDHPTQVSLLDACHDEPLAGHFSADRTFERLCALAWWPGLR
jgi:hypothetical protein